MTDTRELRWLTVRITPENKEELQALSEFDIDDNPYMCYGISSNEFIPSDNLIVTIEELIPDFTKLPEIRLLISLGMSNRDAFRIIYEDT